MKRRIDDDAPIPAKKRRLSNDNTDMNDIEQSLKNTSIALCKFNCNRTVAPGRTRNNNPYNTCCRKCAVSKGTTSSHNQNCDARYSQVMNKYEQSKPNTNPNDINYIMKQLGILAQKSNLIFGSEGEDELNPFIVSKHNYKVIPIRTDIISAIKKSKCLISYVEAISFIITDFIVTIEMDTQFTTEQFMNLLCNNHNILDDFGTSEEDMKKWYLNEQFITDVNERRQCLTIENMKELSGLKGDKDDGWEDEVNWDFVEFMNNNLLNASIITVPSDSYSLKDSKYNPDRKEKYVDNPWNFIHEHLIVGRTDKGDIVGYKTQIVWT